MFHPRCIVCPLLVLLFLFVGQLLVPKTEEEIFNSTEQSRLYCHVCSDKNDNRKMEKKKQEEEERKENLNAN